MTSQSDKEINVIFVMFRPTDIEIFKNRRDICISKRVVDKNVHHVPSLYFFNKGKLFTYFVGLFNE